MNNQYHYNLTGTKRKTFVKIMSRILEVPAVYQKAPTFAYQVGTYTVDKTGALVFPEEADPEEMQKLLTKLKEQGYQPEESIEVSSPQIAEDSHTLTIKLPKGDITAMALDNLKKIVESKATLLKLAIGTECLEIEETEDTLKFPWFTLHGLDGEADAYSRLVTAICNMAKRQKRVTATEKPIENAKFDMRLFLIRLGFIGDEYKTARKILLRNLSGNSSWKSGRKPERNTDTVISSYPTETASSTTPELVFPPDEISIIRAEPEKEEEEGEFYGK